MPTKGQQRTGDGPTVGVNGVTQRPDIIAVTDASISQFELHLRAITDLPLPQPVVNSPSVMINLIGSDVNYDWLKLPLVHLHWYDKEVRPGRKVGHLNLTDSDTSRLTATLEALIPLLPPEYASGVIWAQSKFS